jgi:hypothetical protein
VIGWLDSAAKNARCRAFEAAQKAAHEAVRKAGLVLPKHCEVCGLFDLPLSFHHDSYDRPLDVVPMDRRCHDRRHRALGWGFPNGPDGWQVEGPHWTPPPGTPSLEECGLAADPLADFAMLAAAPEIAAARTAKDEERKGARRRRAAARRAGKRVASLSLVPKMSVLKPVPKGVPTMFQKATKKKQKARVALIGPAGSGKSYTMLQLLKSLGSKIAVIDTERGSCSKYAGDVADFDVCEPEEFSPRAYIKALREAAAAGYDAIGIDSLSHAWEGEGGILDQVDKRGGRFEAWKDMSPQTRELIDAILMYPGHVVATMRTKTEWVVEENAKGKKEPRKIGLAPKFKEGLEYEFDVVGTLDEENVLKISKSRCGELNGAIIKKPGEGMAKTLRAWLEDGVEGETSGRSVREPAKAEPPKAAPSPYKGMAVADTKGADDLRGWCTYYAKAIQKGVAAEDKNAADLVDRVVARGEALSVPELVVRKWLGFEIKTVEAA